MWVKTIEKGLKIKYEKFINIKVIIINEISLELPSSCRWKCYEK